MRTPEQKARAAELAAKWRAENPERYKEQQTRYRVKNSEKKAAKAKEWREKNPEKFAASRNRWLDENKPKMAESNRKACKAYYYRNPEQYVVRGEKRRAAQIQRTPITLTEFDEFILEEAARLRVSREAATGIRWHVDHMLPLRGKTVSGLHACRDKHAGHTCQGQHRQEKQAGVYGARPVVGSYLRTCHGRI